VQQEIDQEADQVATGTDDVQQEIDQKADQVAIGEDVQQEIDQTASQIAGTIDDKESDYSPDVKQVIDQIAEQTAVGGGDVSQTINQIAQQITQDPTGDLSKSLAGLAELYSGGNSDEVNQAISQIGNQIAIGDNINQVINQIAQQTVNNVYKNKINVEIKEGDTIKKTIKKVTVKKGDKCPTQSDSIQLKGKIIPKGVIILADYDPCKLKDGSATLNIPNKSNLKFTVLYLDKNGNDHKGAIIDLDKIQNLGTKNGLYKVDLDKSMKGEDPVTGKTVKITKINGLALYNSGKNSIDFNPGNGLALTSVLRD
ncbi:MAG: hypothetical protein ACPKPY_14135, partial [Nitrososphaeraceae archaeon]